MKIIFDNEEQDEKMVEALARVSLCPVNFGLPDNRCIPSCRQCWENALRREDQMIEIRVVDAADVSRLKARALKLMASPLTHWCGARIKTVMQELNLWEEVNEK